MGHILKRLILGGFFGLALAAGCSNGPIDGATAPTGSKPGSEGTPLVSLPEHQVADSQATTAGITATITTPANQTGFLKFDPDFNRKVPSRTYPVQKFKKTIEETDLVLDLQLNMPALARGTSQVKLMSEGKDLDDAEIVSDGLAPATAHLKFQTRKLTKKERESGFVNVPYEVVIEPASDGKTGSTHFSHLAFSIAVYDSSQPTYVEPRKNSCLIYHQPERASGCYQNRTRSTQEVDFNDSVNHHHEVDVQLSGGISIAPSIVTLNFGFQETIANGTDVSNGSAIHFTNCIECASVIYRQEVETVRDGDIYYVMADGTLSWAGQTTVHSTQVAYEFTSTGSESRNYDCDIPSQLPVGMSPGCKN